MPELETIRTLAREWAATHSSVRVDLDEDETPLYDDAVQISLNDPANEYAWFGFYYTNYGTVCSVDASDDMDEEDRTRLSELADDLISYLKGE
jgi:hypothetical protein